MNDIKDIKKKEFSLKTKSVFLTYPHCPEDKKELLEYLKTLGAVQIVTAMEKHKDGEPHLHAYAKWDKAKMFRERTLDFKGHHPNVQSCKNYLAVIRYIKKDENFLEEGMDTKAYENSRKNKKSYIGEQLINKRKTVEEAVKENPELIFQYGVLKKNVENYHLNTTPLEDFERSNFWIYGPPGIGKSQWVRRTFKSIYTKAQNKWWDGYKGESAVLIDDMDTNALGHYLKIWGDNYGITGEVKGGTIPLPYKQMIITSNYKISELWKEDPLMAEAIARRFKTFTVGGDFTTGYELVELTEYKKY